MLRSSIDRYGTGRTSMAEREIMEYDVIVVGAGPAGLSCAIRLKQLKPELMVAVIEKSSEIGAHILSGAVIEPGPLDRLLPDWRDDPPPICVPVERDEIWLLSEKKRYRLPTPPQQKNHGNIIVSLGAMCAWLANRAEALEVDIFPGYAAADIRFREDGSVGGVIIGDMGVGRDGQPKDSYVEGIEIHAPVTILGEGVRGHLSKQLIERFDLGRDADPQTYGIGMKELWRVQPGKSVPVCTDPEIPFQVLKNIRRIPGFQTILLAEIDKLGDAHVICLYGQFVYPFPTGTEP